MPIEIRLSIEGMHCDGCVRRVTNVLKSVEGVRVDSVNVGSAKVAFEPGEIAPEQILAAVAGIGFTAKIQS
jgi:copper chaperone